LLHFPPDFAILAGAGITNTGPTVITGIPAHPGNIGSTTAMITGFPPGIGNATEKSKRQAMQP
jgi:hypothetical protein